MTFTGTLIVLWYATQPWLWLMLSLLLLLTSALWFGRHRRYTPSLAFYLTVAVISLIIISLIPSLTLSSWDYVRTWVDWLGIVAISLGVILYSYWFFRPVFSTKH